MSRSAEAEEWRKSRLRMMMCMVALCLAAPLSAQTGNKNPSEGARQMYRYLTRDNPALWEKEPERPREERRLPDAQPRKDLPFLEVENHAANRQDSILIVESPPAHPRKSTVVTPRTDKPVLSPQLRQSEKRLQEGRTKETTAEKAPRSPKTSGNPIVIIPTPPSKLQTDAAPKLSNEPAKTLVAANLSATKKVADTQQKSIPKVETIPSTEKAKADNAVTPTPRQGFRYKTPTYYKGIYITNFVIRSKAIYEPLLQKAKAMDINTLVVDVQPLPAPDDFVRMAREAGFYLVARVVVFEGGLGTYPVPANHLASVLSSAEKAAQNGFMEVQLDYIRFADNLYGLRLDLRQRYTAMENILKAATDRLRPLGVRLGADLFGRIAFNQADIIGQKLEVYAPHLDTIYPMLYPSHFYGEPYRISNPYQTIYDGVKNSVGRVGHLSKIVAYIQAFPMSLSGLSMEDYTLKQLRAAEDAGGSGFIAWNARNDYEALFKALEKMRKSK